eukprot:1559025-Pyramimonas_sp.AAC.1
MSSSPVGLCTRSSEAPRGAKLLGLRRTGLSPSLYQASRRTRKSRSYAGRRSFRESPRSGQLLSRQTGAG